MNKPIFISNEGMLLLATLDEESIVIFYLVLEMLSLKYNLTDIMTYKIKISVEQLSELLQKTVSDIVTILEQITKIGLFDYNSETGLTSFSKKYFTVTELLNEKDGKLH